MRKITAYLLIFALVFTLVAPVGVASAQTSGEKLKELGVIQGGTDGDLMETSNWLRQDLVVFLARAVEGLDNEEAIKALPKTHTFTDVTNSFYDGYISWAVENDYFQGRSATVFGFGDDVSNHEFVAVMLRVLGYDTKGANFEGAKELAVEKNLVSPLVNWTAKTTRGQLYGVVLNTLNATMIDSEVTLGAVLELEGYVVEEPVVEPPVEEPVVVEVEISSATSINSKVVEVAIADAVDAVDAALFTVVDKDDAELEVVSAIFAPWDSKSKTVLVTLAAATNAGTLYTISSGETAANFGGMAEDKTKPVFNTVTSSYYNEVELSFSEAILIDGLTVKIAERYGAQTELAVADWKYDGNNKIVVTTGDQKEATLYQVTVEGAVDLAGNEMVETKLTFVGTKKDTSKVKIDSVTHTVYNELEVKFNVRLDASTLSADSFAVAERYGSQTAVEIASVAMKTTGTDKEKTVVIKFAGEGTKAATLYEVVVSGDLKSDVGEGLSATASEKRATFVGVAKPDKLNLGTVVAASNTTVTVPFDQKVEKALAEDVANYVIAEKYGDKAALEVTNAKLGTGDSANTVTLTVAPMKSAVLYEIKVTNIVDIFGNDLVTTSSANVKTFVGQDVAAKITAINSATLTNEGRTLTIIFNGNVNKTDAANVANYFIDGGVGYPSKAVPASGVTNTVVLTVPQTEVGKILEIKATNIKNADGVAMDAAGVTKKFVGAGKTATAPEVVAAIAVDKQTLHIYFDRDVANAAIKGVGKVWNGTTITTPGAVVVEGTTVGALTAYSYDLATLTHTAVKHPENDNVLVVRVDNATQFVADKALSGGVFNVKVAGIHATKNEAVFAATAANATNVKVEGVVALNDKTIRVYFNQPVNVTTTNAIVAVNSTTTTALTTLAAFNAVDSNKTVYDFALAGTLSSGAKYLNVTNLTGFAISTFGYVGLEAKTDAVKASVEFAGSTTVAGTIKDISVVMTNSKELKIFFPEAMDAAQAIDGDNYTFRLPNGTTTVTALSVVSPTGITYDATTNVVTMLLHTTFAAGVHNVIFEEINNVLGTKVVKDGTNKVAVQFAPSTATATKVAVTKAERATTTTVAITLNMVLASNVTTSGQAIQAFEIKDAANTTVAIVDAGTVGKVVTVEIDTAAYVAGLWTISIKTGNELVGINGEAGNNTPTLQFNVQ